MDSILETLGCRSHEGGLAQEVFHKRRSEHNGGGGGTHILCRGVIALLVVHEGKVLLKTVAHCLTDYCEEESEHTHCTKVRFSLPSDDVVFVVRISLRSLVGGQRKKIPFSTRCS